MSDFAIGDIQGCYDAFVRLLDKLQFDPATDKLWLAGDLVNRGPHNLEVLRTVKALGPSAQTILGNHDLHLLAIAAGAKSISKKDTLQDVLQAPDCTSLLDWLAAQPLMITTPQWVLSHAGVPHIWSVAEAQTRANEVAIALQGPTRQAYFNNMYGNIPNCWQDELEGHARLRIITNYFTRMRFIHPTGELNLKAKEGITSAPSNTRPWFDFERPPSDAPYRFLFGHWAALEGKTSNPQRYCALDTGCVWGGTLTALNLQTGETTAVDGYHKSLKF